MCAIALNIIEQVLIYLPLLCGAYMVLSLMKVPDLSIASAFVFGAVCSALVHPFLSPGMNCLVIGVACVAASLIGGALVGLCSGLITHVGRVPHLLSAIITTGLFYGLMLYCLQGPYRALSGTNPLAGIVGGSTHTELGGLLVVAVVVSAFMFLFLRSQLGYACAAYGDNPSFFTHYRASTGAIFLMGSALGNAMAGLSGYLFAQTSGFVDISMGVDVLLFCITALMLGKLLGRSTLHSRERRLTIAVPFGGLVLYCVLQQLLLRLHFNLKYFSSVHALVVLGIVLYVFNRRDVRMSAHSDHLGV